MKLQSLLATNIECFSGEREFVFSSRFTLLIGANGSGKSAVLRMAATALGSFLSALGVPAPAFSSSQVRRVPGATSGSDTSVLPSSIATTATFADRSFEWQRALVSSEGRTLKRDDIASLKEAAAGIVSALEGRESIPLPLLAHYSSPRLKPSPNPDATENAHPRLTGYLGCLESSLEVDAPAALATLAVAADEDPNVDMIFGSVNAALSVLLDCDVVLEQREGELHLGLELEPLLPWDAHPASIRRNVALVADLVRRGCMLNPDLGVMAPAQIEGVVLVDDPETHLHPRWARGWVEGMQRLFPKVQFIGATNSPFLIQSLHDGEIIDLNRRKTANRQCDLSIEDIVEEYQGVPVPQRSKRYHDMNRAAEQFMRLVQEGKDADPERKRVVKAKLDALMRPYSNEPAFQAVLKMERVVAGLGPDDGSNYDFDEEED